MSRVWEKFEVNISADALEVISIRSLRQLRPYRNFYNLDLAAIHENTNANSVLIVDKKLNSILGFIKFQASALGNELIASQRFDTFPIERLDLNCLEVVGFEIAEAAWNRLGFKNTLVNVTQTIMSELGSEALIVHYQDKVESQSNLIRQIHTSPFYSPLIYCEKYQKSEGVTLDSPIHDRSVDKCHLPPDLNHLLQCGLEIWSEPIFYNVNSTISLLLGYLGRKGLSQARPLAVGRVYQKGGRSASY